MIEVGGRRGGLVTWTLAGLLGASIGPASAQDAAPAAAGQDDPAASPTMQQFFRELEEAGIGLDLEHGEVRVRGVLRRSRPDPARPIELGVVSSEGSTHEALGVVETERPSLINACLLLLGLEPGHSRQFVAAEPMPTEEDVALGLELPYRVLPPEGDRIFLSLRWIDDEGEERIEAIEDLLIQLETGEPLPMRGFVYVGSRFVEHMGEQRYVADLEGNVVLLFQDKAFPENCLMDVYATDREDYRNIDVDVRKVPPAGTPVEFVFSTRPRPGTRPLVGPEKPVAMIGDPRDFMGRSRSPFLAEAPRDLLERIGPRSLEEYRRMLRRAEPPLRKVVAGLLGVCGHPDAVEMLGRQLRFDRDDEVRLACAWALVEIADEAAVRELIRTLEDAWWAARDDAVFALRLLSGQDRGRRPEAWRAWQETHFSGD